MLVLDPDGALARAARLARRGGRTLLGIAGPPGAGKSALAARIAAALGDVAAVVPLDGFHLPQAELRRLGRRARMGAPDTFDARGYVALLRRVRDAAGAEVRAPGFDRAVEEPVPGAIVVRPAARLVVAEGNYLLVDAGDWAQVAPLLDEAWYLELDEATRLRRLIARHVAHGKAPEAAREWALGPDQANAALVARTRERADAVVHMPAGGEP